MRDRVVLPRDEAQRSDQHDEREEAPKPNKPNLAGTELAPNQCTRRGAEECEGEGARKEGKRRRLRREPSDRVRQDETRRESRSGARSCPAPRNDERRQEYAATRPRCTSKESDPAAN